MLIQTLPPRRMCRVMAIRALSICRLVTYAGSRAWMPHSPKVTAVPPLAAPERSGWCCLRCLTRRGMSIGQPSDPLLVSRSTAVGAGGGRPRRGGLLAGQLALRDVALVDQDLHADPAEGRAGLVEPVVDVRPEGVQRHAPLAVELRAAHLGAAEAARALHPDPLGAGAQRGLHALAHGAAEGDAARELLGDALGDQLRVDLGVAHLEDVQLDLLARQLLELRADAVGLRAAAPDHDARAGGVDVDADPVPGALDLDAADARALHALRHELADGHVLLDVVAVALPALGPGREPPALVLGGDAEAEPVRVDLLPH